MNCTKMPQEALYIVQPYAHAVLLCIHQRMGVLRMLRMLWEHDFSPSLACKWFT